MCCTSTAAAYHAAAEAPPRSVSTPEGAGQIPPSGGFATAAAGPRLDARSGPRKGAMMRWALKVVQWVAGYVI